MDFIIGICSSIVGEIARFTIGPVGRQLGYLFYYQRNKDDLVEKFGSLTVKKTRIDREVGDARREGKEIDEEVKKWRGDVEQCSKDAKDILEHEGHREAECSCTRPFPNLVMRRKLSRKAKKTVAVITRKIEEAGAFKSISYMPILRSSFKNPDFEGFDTTMSTLKEIMEALEDPNFRRIGVRGPGGVGKTTLVKEVARKSQEEGLFTEVVMATVSQSFDLQNIQKDIACQLGMKMELGESMSALAGRLQHRLKGEKRLLIILDDLWKKLELEKAGIYLDKDDQKGCKMLLVSRDLHVLRNDMGADTDIMVNLLSETEAMNLFNKVVGGRSEEPDFRDLAIKIVEKCGDLPVAIKPIASALKGRDKSAWRTTLWRFNESLKQGKDGAYTCIKTSYDFLGDEEKMVLLLCSQHRQGENISVEDLTNIYAASCGLFLEVNTLQKARDLLKTLVENLQGHSLLLDGDNDGLVKLHDVVREIMVSIAMEDKRVYCYDNVSGLNSALGNGKLDHDAIGISLLGNDFNQFPDGLPCSKLKLLLMHQDIYWSEDFRPILFPKDFSEKAKELRAFCLSSMIVQLLPLSPCPLQNLQTLSLRDCILGEIAFIGELKNLVVLDLCRSKFEQLPEQIGKLTCLRQLNLNGCTELKVIQPNVFSSLVKLEELYMDDVDVEWGVEAVNDERRNASLVELKNLPQLSALHLCIKDAGVLPNDMFVNGKLERFYIVVGDFYMGRETSSRLLYLDLHESNHLYEPGFPMLIKATEVLSLRNLPGVTCGLPSFDEKVAFPNRPPVSSSSMPNLTELYIGSCISLKHVFSSVIVGSLTQLEKLMVIECPGMKEIIAVEEGTSSQKILFPKLKSLKLEDLESLETFCGGDCKIEFESLFKLEIDNCPLLTTFTSKSMPTTSTRSVEEKIEQPLINDKVVSKNLQELSISDCNRLQYLLSFEAVKSLEHLKYLRVLMCKGMKQIVTRAEGGDDGRLKNILFPKLEFLQLYDLPKLERFCEGDCIECPFLLELKILLCLELRTFIPKSASVEEGELLAQQPLFNKKVVSKNLQELSISGCDSLRYLLAFEMVESLEHLKCLRVLTCKGMKQIVTRAEGGGNGRLKNILFPKLESLELYDLPELKRFCEGDRIECPCLLELKIQLCLELRTFIPKSTSVEEGELPAQQPLFNKKVVSNNLQELSIIECDSLQYLLAFEVVESLEHLKCLRVLTCKGMKQIVTRQEGDDGRLKNISFPKLKSLELYDLPELKRFCEGDRIECPCLLELKIQLCLELRTFIPKSTSVEEGELLAQQPLFNKKVVSNNLQELSIVECDSLQYLLAFEVVESLEHLKCLRVLTCKGMKQIVTRKEGDDGRLKNISFPKLQSLELYYLPELKRFCEGDRIECPCLLELKIELCFKFWTFIHKYASIEESELVGQQLRFNKKVVSKNLQKLSICGCDSLQYLLPFEAVESLMHLKYLKVLMCKGMKQIVTRAEGGDDGRLKNILFPKLESLELYDLPKLKRFCEGDRIECPCLLELKIMLCFELRTFIPKSASVEESELVVQQPLFNKKVVSKNLQKLSICGCDSLQYLLPFEAIESLEHLKYLKVLMCKGMKQIVTRTEGGDDERLKSILFPKLESLELYDLPKLKRFCEGDSIECPCLLELKVKLHFKFWTFIPKSASVEESELVGQPPRFNKKVVFTSLEKLTVSDWDGDINEIWPHQSSTILFPNLKVLELVHTRYSGFFLSKIPCFVNLERLNLRGCLKENLWQHEEHGLTLTHLRILKVSKLPNVMYLFEDAAAESIQLIISQTVRYLDTLSVNECERLKTLVKSSTFSFENLTELQLSRCHVLVNLFDSSIAKSLVQLKTMSISECNQLIQVIIDDVNKKMEDHQIVFSQLRDLRLDCLPNLKSFYGGINKLEFPKLEKLVVTGCPEMRTFSHGMSINSPSLKRITGRYSTDLVLYFINEDLEGDLNASIRKLWEKSMTTH